MAIPAPNKIGSFDGNWFDSRGKLIHSLSLRIMGIRRSHGRPVNITFRRFFDIGFCHSSDCFDCGRITTAALNCYGGVILCCLAVNGIYEETAHNKSAHDHATKKCRGTNGFPKPEKLRRARICHSPQTSCGAGETKQIPEISGDRQGLKSASDGSSNCRATASEGGGTSAATCFLFAARHHSGLQERTAIIFDLPYRNQLVSKPLHDSCSHWRGCFLAAVPSSQLV